MRTTLELDEARLKRVMKLARVNTRREALQSSPKTSTSGEFPA